MSPPLSLTTLKTIAQEACDQVLGSTYNHAETQQWNEKLINQILSALITQTSINGADPEYKYMVNSTIIQHTGPAHSSAEETTSSAGRRGMHSAAGAYWNNEKDGMWSYKYEGGDGRGMDVVICVMWVGI